MQCIMIPLLVRLFSLCIKIPFHEDHKLAYVFASMYPEYFRYLSLQSGILSGILYSLASEGIIIYFSIFPYNRELALRRIAATIYLSLHKRAIMIIHSALDVLP